MTIVPVRRSLSLVIALGVLATQYELHAQSTTPSGSQLPPGETVERTTPPASLDLRLGGVTRAPAGAESMPVTLEALDIEAGFPELEAETRALTPAAGATLTLAEVYDLVRRLQEAYFEAGYPLVRAFIPVQDVNQSKARIKVRVVSGFISEVDASAVPERVRAPVEAFTRPLVGRKPVTARELERAVLLAGEVAGTSLRSTLMAGRAEGETRLILAAEHRFVQTALSLDNRLSNSLGGKQVTASMALNGLLKRGDRMGLTAASSLADLSLSKDATRRYLGLFFDTLLGSSGLALGVDTAVSSSMPQGAASVLELRNDFERWGFTAAYPTVRHRYRSANTRLSLDFVDESQGSELLGFPVTLSRDRTRVVRLAHDEQWRAPKGRFEGVGLGMQVEYSRGLDIFNARMVEDATPLEPLSRSGADAVFDKLQLGVWATAASERLGLIASLELRAQTGFGDPLLRSEQFSAASSTMLSGLPTGAVVGDRALAGRVQIGRPAQVGTSRITPYLYGAKARLDLEQPTVLEPPQTRLQAYGFGVRGDFNVVGDYAAVVALEWSRTDATEREFDDNAVAVRVTFRR